MADRERGRPPGTTKPASERASKKLDLRVTAAELASYHDAADDAGVPMSQWVRDTLNAAIPAMPTTPAP